MLIFFCHLHFADTDVSMTKNIAIAAVSVSLLH